MRTFFGNLNKWETVIYFPGCNPYIFLLTKILKRNRWLIFGLQEGLLKGKSNSHSPQEIRNRMLRKLTPDPDVQNQPWLRKFVAPPWYTILID